MLPVKYENEGKNLLGALEVEQDGGAIVGEGASSVLFENLEAIKKLKELLDLGAITKEEFEQKKNELLGLVTKQTTNKNKMLTLLWGSLGCAAFSYLVNVIISLNVGGNLFWMFDYILYGYIAGFLLMAIGIVGYVLVFRMLKKDNETKKARIISLILMVALLLVTFSPLVLHEPCKFESNIAWAGIGDGGYSVVSCEHRRTNVKIPSKYKSKTVTAIGYGAFSNHGKLEKIKLPDSITSISGSAFAYCDNLTTLVIPDSVTYIGEGAFIGCTSLVIYCETSEKPEGWVEDWNCRFNNYGDTSTKSNWQYVTVYWAGEWEYNRLGKPVPIQ